MPEEKGICTRIREQYERSMNAYWDKAHTSMRRRREFLAGDRYVFDEGEHNKDRRRIQIRGMDVADSNRHIAAKLTERPRSVEARPIDKIDDPDMSETAAAIVEWDLGNPWKCFDDRVEGWILDGVNAAMGVLWMDLCKEGKYGPYAERIVRRIDPENCIWDECYEDPHEPGCTFFLEKQRLPVKEIHATWKGSGWVKPDKEGLTPNKSAKTGYPVLLVSGRHALHNVNVDDEKATIWKCWYKNDYSEREKKDDTSEPLPPEQQYLVCTSGCGYRSETQDLMPEPLPEVLEMGCPTCGGNLERVEDRAITPTERAYSRGKRLVIIAPFQNENEEKPIYDGKWPVPTARSFPGAFWTPYQQPGEPVGKCEVDNMWDAQIASDQLKTHMVKQVFTHQIYWKMPRGVYENWQGEQWTGVDTDYNLMLYDGSNQFVAPVEGIKGTGLDPNIGLALQVINQTLTAYKPSGDIGLSQQDSKDIAVGTVEAIERQGETPVEHMNRRKNRALSKFYGVVWDYDRATITPAQLQRLRIEGVDMVVDGIAGDDLPNFDFWIEDTPRFAGIEKDRAQAFQTLMQAGTQAQMSGQDPALVVEVFSEINNLPKSVMRKVQKLFATPNPMAGGIPGAPPLDGAMGTSGAEGPGGIPPELLDEGLNGAGIPPAPVA